MFTDPSLSSCEAEGPMTSPGAVSGSMHTNKQQHSVNNIAHQACVYLAKWACSPDRTWHRRRSWH